MSQTVHSDFWIGDDNVEILESLEYIQLIKLAQYRRAISNFVNILTNRRIPVLFNTTDKNATDGEVVYLSPNISKRKDFDVAVGLSLHEGSHIVYSDFTMLKTLWQRTPRHLYDIAGPNNIDQTSVVNLLKTMLNYVEDRYIDAFIYKSAPGYRGYYEALYEKYFNTEKNVKGLQSDAYRNPSLVAYEFRIINFTNPATDLSALPDLEVIYNLINMSDILRLKKPEDRLDIAIKVCELILKNVVNRTCGGSGKQTNSSQKPTGSSKKSTESGADPLKSDSSEKISDDKDDTVGDKLGGNDVKSEVDEPSDESDKIGGNKSQTRVQFDDDGDLKKLIDDVGDVDDLTETELNDLKKNIERQKKFLNGDLKLGTLSEKESASIDAISRSGMTLIRVGKDLSENVNFKGIECVFVKKMTHELISDPKFPLFQRGVAFKSQKLENSLDDAVSVGISKGRVLGRKLQLRDVVNVTKYMRQPRGKIDKRLINELGHGEENVFFTTHTDKYKSVFIHISVDASASMIGPKWDRTITTVVAICKAASMISNIRVSVSFRTTVSSTYGNGDSPYVIMAYDSKVDTFSKVASQFRKLSPNNTTPEGLAFEAIMENLPVGSPDEDRFFLNLSDGEPYFNYSDDSGVITYAGDVAFEHTRKQVLNVRNRGYTVMSYFIENLESNDVIHNGVNLSKQQSVNFKRMYGKDASFIDVNNVSKIANTLNAMFLKKEE